jgi:Uncharacterized conserved protein (COG2071)
MVYDGLAWVGVTPFKLVGPRARKTYPLPFISNFPELNVRTYVAVDGKPGHLLLFTRRGERARAGGRPPLPPAAVFLGPHVCSENRGRRRRI